MASDDIADSGVAQSGKRRVIGAVVVVGLLAILASFRGLLTLYTDYLWFDDLDRTSVWTGILGAQIILSVIFVAIFFVLAWINLVIADRIAPALRPPGPEEELLIRWHETVGRRNGLIRFAIAGFFALVAGGGAAAQWNEWVLFTNPVDFGQVDPVFDKDISFYVFRLPFLNFVVDWFFAAFIIIGIITGIWHYINGGIRLQTIDRRATPQVKAHVSVILAVLAALKAADYYLQRFGLLNSTQGFGRGAFYTDLNATLPAIQLLFLISLFSVGLLVANIWRRGWALPTVAVGLWGLIAVLAGGIYPTVIQQFQVSPDELAREREYIDRNIDATRIASGLDVIAADFDFDDAPLTREQILDNGGAFSTVRLLDPRIVDDSFTRNQQDLEIYDDFQRKVDVDRYVIDDKITPVVVAAREIANQPSVSWQVRHAIRTHGYGLVLAPANEFNVNGEPEFLIGGVPLENRLSETIDIDRPQIYFGEGITSYAVTGTTEAEFDFIEGYEYDGAGGIPMSGMLERVAFAFRFGAIEPVISGIITDDTEVIFARDVTERAQRIAPFLEYDSNPYPIVVDGGISYVIDAYTTSDQFPYAETSDVNQLPNRSGLKKRFNYVRNSVKAVVDAYDGTVDFYVTDPDDPLINAYSQEFPGLFRDASVMPEEVAAHLRYPQDLFVMQTAMWGLYQLDDAGDLFTGDLRWTVAANPDDTSSAVSQTGAAATAGTAVVAAANRPVDPYYQVTQLPDEDEPSFLVSRTFVPAAVPELRAYLVGRIDTTGKLELREYDVSGTNRSARGPVQIDGILNSNPEISEESTELGRGGSQFLAGNLVPLLIENAIVYVRPFYVQREPQPNEVTEPQVKFVAVIQEDRLGFAPTYAGALSELFDITFEEARILTGADSGSSLVPVDPGEVEGPSGIIDLGEAGPEVTARLDDILAKFSQAESALPDFGEYQRLQNEALAELQGLLDDVASTVEEEVVLEDDPDSA